MKLFLKIFYFLTMHFFLQVGVGYTDTVRELKRGK